MLASWRVVRDFEVLEEGTGAGADVVCAVEGRKPARKDLDRRAAARVTTFLEWAEVVLESRGADIWYYCHYMNGDSGQVVTGGVGDPTAWLAARLDAMVQSSQVLVRRRRKLRVDCEEIRTMMQMEFLVGYYQGAAWGRHAPTHGCLSELQSPTGRILQPSLCKSGSSDRPQNGTWAPWRAPHLHCRID